jgi:hypothetical protein
LLEHWIRNWLSPAPETGHTAAEHNGRVRAMLPDLLEPVGLHVHEGDRLHHAETDQEHVRLPVGRVGKNPVFYIKKQPSGFFLVFLFFCFFFVFFVFFGFLYICPEERVLGFSQFQEYF